MRLWVQFQLKTLCGNFIRNPTAHLQVAMIDIRTPVIATMFLPVKLCHVVVVPFAVISTDTMHDDARTSVHQIGIIILLRRQFPIDISFCCLLFRYKSFSTVFVLARVIQRGRDLRFDILCRKSRVFEALFIF